MVDWNLEKSLENYKNQIADLMRKYAVLWEELGNDSPEIYRIIDLVCDYYQNLENIQKRTVKLEDIIRSNENSLLYLYLFQKICLNQIHDSQNTLQLRRVLLQKKSKLLQSFELVDESSDLSKCSEPCIQLLSDSKRSFKIIAQNSAFSSLLMLPNSGIINRDFFYFVPKCLNIVYRNTVIDLLT